MQELWAIYHIFWTMSLGFLATAADQQVYQHASYHWATDW